MQRMTRIKIAEPDIVKLFDQLGRKVFTRTELDKILAEHRANWRLAQSMTNRAFIDYLIEQTEMQEVILAFPIRKETRYLWGAASPYELALSLRPGCYLTHYSAMFIHELTEQIPKTIYINQEQPKHGQGTAAALLQERIDNAFRNKVRVSNEIATYGDFRICILHGMNTGKLGVIELDGSEGERLRVTNLERTLIDIVVRPVYSGGVHEVLKAYRRAKDQVSVNKMTALLKKLQYAYPYHQVVGFYLDKAGYKQSALQLLKKFPMNFNFYLEHNMSDTEFSTEWRLFYPKGF